MDEKSTKINANILTKSLHSHNTTMESQYSLISTIVTLYTLIFLYFPTNIAASPLIISTSLLLLSLLRLGAAQRISQQQTHKKNQKPKSDSVDDPDPDPNPLQFHAHSSVEFNTDTNSEKDSLFHPDHDPIQFHDHAFVDSNVDSISQKESVLDPEPEPEPEPRPFYGDCFVEWNVRAPLEVIYEAYEGEEEEEEEEYTEEKRDEELRVIERYASLSMYYPETDTDSSSEGDSPEIKNWDSPENVCFRWEDEDREELIEIELDCKRSSEVEEENLIEIDLTPASFPVR